MPLFLSKEVTLTSINVLCISLSAEVPSENLLPPVTYMYMYSLGLFIISLESETYQIYALLTYSINLVHKYDAWFMVSGKCKHFSDQSGTFSDIFVNNCT